MSASVMQLYSRAMSANSLNTRGPPNIMPDEPFKPRIRPDGKPYYDKDKVGSDIARVFQWDVKEDNLLPLDTVARRRIRQKNYITLNRDEVKRIEERVKDSQKKVREDLKAELTKPLWKSDKYNGVNSKVVTKEMTHQPTTKEAKIFQKHSNRRHSATRNKNNFQNGTIPNGFGHHGIQERSKSVDPLHLEEENLHLNEEIKTPRPTSTIARKGSAHSKSNNNFVQNNVQAAARQSIKRAPSTTALDDLKKKMDEAIKNHPNGQLPDYLKSRKKAWQIANEPPKSPLAPPGHVLMNYEEKTQTLSSLKRAEADLLKKFNSLPVRTDTDFLKRRKQQLMKQLEEVDEALKIFSRPKVFIKTDQY